MRKFCMGVAVAAALTAAVPASASPGVPEIAWADCGDGFQCATAPVPLDYRDPASGSVGIWLIRKPAADPAHRIGTLFVNPGGPGGNSEAQARWFGTQGPAELRARFDIVSFEPRGVRRSSAVTCMSQADYTAAWAEAKSRPVPGSYERAVAQGKQFADACQRESARMLPFIGTEYVARDMDRLRQALGEQKLNYAGFSYGTYIGTVYANLFPDRIRVMSLDSAYNPETYVHQPYDYDYGQYVAVESALNRFFDWCTGTSKCTFGAGDPRKAFADLQNALDADPVTGQNGRFTANGAVLTHNVTVDLGGGIAGWPQLAEDLVAAQHRSGALLTPPSAAYLAANTAVECADRKFQFPGSNLLLRARLAQAAQAAPLTGPALAYAVPNYDQAHATACTQWPVQSKSLYTGPFNAPMAPPILVVGITGDPDTPYQDAVSLAAILRSGRLLTYRGEGHIALLRSEQCVSDRLVAYLVDGILPPQGTVCQD